jgi:large conductance mechanosensitive channel
MKHSAMEAVMLKEFRDFIIKGNALQLAIGVILAVAFGALVVAFTEGILMALVAAVVGKPDFNALAYNLNGTPIQYGRVLTAALNLILVGAVLFAVVKAVNRVMPPAKAPETDHELLAQIRDELRTRPPRVVVTEPVPAGLH